jgi:hypothetical protein
MSKSRPGRPIDIHHLRSFRRTAFLRATLLRLGLQSRSDLGYAARICPARTRSARLGPRRGRTGPVKSFARLRQDVVIRGWMCDALPRPERSPCWKDAEQMHLRCTFAEQMHLRCMFAEQMRFGPRSAVQILSMIPIISAFRGIDPFMLGNNRSQSQVNTPSTESAETHYGGRDARTRCLLTGPVRSTQP